MMSAKPDEVAPRLAFGGGVLSAALLGLLVVVYLRTESSLAFAQAADSLSDIFTAVALFVSMRVAAAPPDESHPIGHQKAEPVAALVAAVMAGVLAFEVLRGAAVALIDGSEPLMTYSLLGVFTLKVVLKAALAALSARGQHRRPSPALRALYVDARNDVAVGLLAVGGFFAARWGASAWDAWLAIPVGLYVGWSGFDLARENIRLLMGEAPPEERRRALEEIAQSVDGVESVHGLVARFHGVDLDVLIHVVVDPELSLRLAHDIGHAVEARLFEEGDVCHAVAHVDVEVAETDAGESLPSSPAGR